MNRNIRLRTYIETEILPLYDNFDKAHGRDHARAVIEQSQALADYYDVDRDMLYAAAAFHDIGLSEGREHHHLSSGRMIRENRKLREWFTEEQIETIAQAAEDHRASSDHEPRTIYGRIIAESDRLIDPMTVLRRCVQYGLDKYPGLNKEEQWERCLSHIKDKYGEGGYLKLWIPESPNAERLRALREIISDKPRLREIFNGLYEAEI